VKVGVLEASSDIKSPFLGNRIALGTHIIIPIQQPRIELQLIRIRADIHNNNLQLLFISESLCSPLFMNMARNVKGMDTMRLIMITVSRVFSSKCIPQKGRIGIGNKNTSHSPTSMTIVFHRFLSMSRNIYPALIT
jgi:hypothetical protein